MENRLKKGLGRGLSSLLGDTKKGGVDAQEGTLRKSTVTSTPLMNILVSSITIPSRYIEKQKKAITIECGLQNGTLAVFVSTKIFD